MNENTAGRQPGELIKEVNGLSEMIAQLTDAMSGLRGSAGGIEDAINPIDGGPLPEGLTAGASGAKDPAATPMPCHPSGIAGDVSRCTEQIFELIKRINDHKERCYQIVERLNRIA